MTVSHSFLAFFLCGMFAVGSASAFDDPERASGEEREAELAALESEATYFTSQVGAAGAGAPQMQARTPSTGTRSSRSSYSQLARAPAMFGDSIFSAGSILARIDAPVTGANVPPTQIQSDIPSGGGRSMKIGENNKPIPQDRVYFAYSGFQNAVPFNLGPGNVGEANLNRATLGIEKTFLDQQWSIDVRMPISDTFSFNVPNASLATGSAGNLSMFLKHLLFRNEAFAAAAGVGLGLPTAADVKGTFGQVDFRLQNDAVHLIPYFGMIATPNDLWFGQGFLSVDFATNGNTVLFSNPTLQEFGKLQEQNLLNIDLSVGRWLARNDDARYFLGCAAIFELHYTTTIQDADAIAYNASNLLTNVNGVLGNAENRIDLLNLTAGLHFQISALSNLRVACVSPLRAAPDRAFDSEIQVSFNRYF